MYYFMCYSDILFILGTRHTITPELISLYIEEIFNDFLSSLFSCTIENDVDVPTTTTTTTEVDDSIRNINTNTSKQQLKKSYNAHNILQSHELIDNFLFNNVGIWDRDIPEVPIVEYNIEQTELNIIKLDRHMKNLSFNKLASMDEVHQQMIDTQDNSPSSSSHDLAIHDTLNTVKSKINDKFFYYIDNNNEHLKKMMMFKNNLDELFHIESIEKERMMEILHSWVITFSVLMFIYVFYFIDVKVVDDDDDNDDDHVGLDVHVGY